MNKKDIILKAENISKQYRLGSVGTGTLSHDLNRWWHKLRGKEDPYLKVGEANDRTTKGTSEYVWALQDINFEVERGEVLGIIGKNGAGKSTLLKILSKVTAPTTGSIKTRGRIASLLEVGTGFHPELTGRENVYLNGAILGMTKKEIISKLDEIIAFSGCERYIDTPTKRYSSGMTVRLAFAVAAFLEPEILVVDEVLAVGDVEFQKKAIGKMQDISKEGGRTVLFVSHNMAAVKSLCTKGIVLEHGKVAFSGNAEECVSFYLGGKTNENPNERYFEGEVVSDFFSLDYIGVKNSVREFSKSIVENEPIEIHTKFTLEDSGAFHITYHLYNELGEAMFSFYDKYDEIKLTQGNNHVICTIPKNFLQSGNFTLALFLVENKKRSVFSERDIFSFAVVDREREIGTYMGREPGYITPQFEWKKL
jgi:lipopolysaccharide transport system ATP-binding protein